MEFITLKGSTGEGSHLSWPRPSASLLNDKDKEEEEMGGVVAGRKKW
jgi:hypothetical protein